VLQRAAPRQGVTAGAWAAGEPFTRPPAGRRAWLAGHITPPRRE